MAGCALGRDHGRQISVRSDAELADAKPKVTLVAEVKP